MATAFADLAKSFFLRVPTTIQYCGVSLPFCSGPGNSGNKRVRRWAVLYRPGILGMMVALCSVGKNETHRSSFPSRGSGGSEGIGKKEKDEEGVLRRWRRLGGGGLEKGGCRHLLNSDEAGKGSRRALIPSPPALLGNALLSLGFDSLCPLCQRQFYFAICIRYYGCIASFSSCNVSHLVPRV